MHRLKLLFVIVGRMVNFQDNLYPAESALKPDAEKEEAILSPKVLFDP